MAQLPSSRRIRETLGLPERSQYDKLPTDAERLSYKALPKGKLPDTLIIHFWGGK
jgi:hypothetical protein